MNKFNKASVFVAGALLSITLSSTTSFAADYTTLSNDSLYKIGVLFQTSVSNLMSDNNLNSDVIYPGQILEVPAALYTVKPSDSLYLIAKKHGITLSSLRTANNKWDDLIMPGQQLILPSLSETKSSSSSTELSTQESTTKKSNITTNTIISYTDEEVDLLARLIHAEAGGESYNAQVAVGAVIVNRVLSPEWPSTISTVINHISGGYQQFTPVKNGYIKNPATDKSIQAAWAALYGSDPSKEALFYFDDSSKNEWLWAKPMTAHIDSMVFVR